MQSRALVVASALLASTPWLAAAAPAERAPVFQSEVSLVQLPVFVADKDGRALGGLGPEEFELYDDGRRVEVVSFRYVDTTSPEAQQSIREAPAARRRFLFLFDLSFTDPGGLHRARVAAREIVRRGLAESDLAGVATYDVTRGVRLVANFSEDRAVLAHAIETLGAPNLVRISDALGLALGVSATEARLASSSLRRSSESLAAADLFVVALANRLRRAEEQTYRAQVMGLLESLDELGRSLRGIEGRKQILYFSTGFDSQTLIGTQSATDLFQDAEAVIQGRLYDVDSDRRYGDNHVRGTLGRMARTVSGGDSVIHGVDVSGLSAIGDAQDTLVRADAARDTRGQDSLQVMASETGGLLLKDRNDLADALHEILDTTSRYYVLGYQPGDLKGPGVYHKLKVKLRRKGARLSHRAGFYERVPAKAQSALQRKFEAAQLVMTGAGPNDLRFSALCLPFPAPGELQTVGVVLQVPKRELEWGRTLGLEVYGYAVDAEGVVHGHLARFARVEPALADKAGDKLGLALFGSFALPPGEYTLRLALTERESDITGYQFLDVSVPAHDPRLGFLLPPVLLDEAGEWVTLDLSTAGDAPTFELEGRRFLPRTSFDVEPGRAQKLMVIAYPSEQATDPAAPIAITSALLNASGQPVGSGGLRIERVLRDAEGRHTYLLDYTPEGLAPGDYRLRVALDEGNTRLESYSLLRVLGGAVLPAP